jgi:hypothetical protein
MASIKKNEGKYGDTYRVQIRKKGQKVLNRTFSDYATAFIWAKYKETIIEERMNFDADPNDQYTILDVMMAKYGEESRDFQATVPYFKEIYGMYLGSLSYEKLLDHAKKLLQIPVKRGGSKKNNSGKTIMPSVMTILRKYAYLSAAISFMQDNGVNLINNAAKVVTYLRKLNEKDKENGKT